MNNKKKLIGIGALVVVSLGVALYNFSTSRINSDLEKDTVEKVEDETIEKTESSDDTIQESDVIPSYTNEQEKPIWIKNITLLSDNNQTYNTILALKSKLNTELKTIDKDTFEVELIEDTYKSTDDGFSVEARADKIDGRILIEYTEYEYTFTIISN